MPEPLVSILINNYNYGRYLGDAIESALNQTYRHAEVIVVDDGSTDDSRDVIASFGSRVISVLKANGGQGSAFNAGFAASRGNIICFLDSDDWFLSEKTAEVVAAFAHGEYGWFFHLLSTNGNGGAPPDPGFQPGAWDYRAQMAAGLDSRTCRPPPLLCVSGVNCWREFSPCRNGSGSPATTT
jgi:glycosyltransferase involved in cell wall biosynthesis